MCYIKRGWSSRRLSEAFSSITEHTTPDAIFHGEGKAGVSKQKLHICKPKCYNLTLLLELTATLLDMYVYICYVYVFVCVNNDVDKASPRLVAVEYVYIQSQIYDVGRSVCQKEASERQTHVRTTYTPQESEVLILFLFLTII